MKGVDLKRELCKKNKYTFRMADDESDFMNEMVKKTGKTKSEILREALNMYRNLAKYRD